MEYSSWTYTGSWMTNTATEQARLIWADWVQRAHGVLTHVDDTAHTGTYLIQVSCWAHDELMTGRLGRTG